MVNHRTLSALRRQSSCFFSSIMSPVSNIVPGQEETNEVAESVTHEYIPTASSISYCFSCPAQFIHISIPIGYVYVAVVSTGKAKW